MKKTPEQNGKGAFVRMCSTCRKRQPASQMFRLIRTPGGVVLDDGKSEGRSAYLCRNPECIAKAGRSHAPDRMLGCPVDSALYADLGKRLENGE